MQHAFNIPEYLGGGPIAQSSGKLNLAGLTFEMCFVLSESFPSNIGNAPAAVCRHSPKKVCHTAQRQLCLSPCFGGLLQAQFGHGACLGYVEPLASICLAIYQLNIVQLIYELPIVPR